MTIEQVIEKFNPDFDMSKVRDRDYLAEYCKKIGVDVKDNYGAGKLQTEIFDATGESKLREPTFIIQYPAEVSPLARKNDDDPFVTDRFELFIAGREIANGFSELNDSEDQAERFRQQVENAKAGDDEAMSFDHDYIRALEYGMPPTGHGYWYRRRSCCDVADGFGINSRRTPVPAHATGSFRLTLEIY